VPPVLGGNNPVLAPNSKAPDSDGTADAGVADGEDGGKPKKAATATTVDGHGHGREVGEVSCSKAETTMLALIRTSVSF
jgi:hypothetical protein